MVRLLLFLSLIVCVFAPWGIAAPGDGLPWLLVGLGAWIAKVALLSVCLGLFETMVAKMRIFRIADFLGGALLLALLAIIFLYVSEAV
jgi:formate hydrogenlyase subunit 4